MARGFDARFWRWAFYACALAVLVLAIIPPLQQPVPSTGWDKADHLAAFLVLGLLGVRAHPANQMQCHLGLVGFAIAIELVQALLPWRDPSLLDLLADGAGLVAALGLSTLGRTRLQS